MASKSFGLFVNTLQSADEQLQVQIMYIIYDLLILHDNNALVSGTLPVCPFQNHGRLLMKQPDQLVGLVRHTLGYESPEVQAAACTGAVKLLLTHVITDPQVPSKPLKRDKKLISGNSITGPTILFLRDGR
jgi:condensin complex subunit 3